MTTVLAMLVLASVCWVFRILFIVLIPAERLPASATTALAQLAPAVLAALVATEAHAAAQDSDLTTASLVVGSMLLAGLAVRLTGNLLLAIGIGVGAVLLIDLLLLG